MNYAEIYEGLVRFATHDPDVDFPRDDTRADDAILEAFDRIREERDKERSGDVSKTMATRYKERAEERLALSLGIPVAAAEVSDKLAAIMFALDLMRGDPATFKAGYAAPDAALAASEVFGVPADEIEEAI